MHVYRDCNVDSLPAGGSESCIAAAKKISGTHCVPSFSSPAGDCANRGSPDAAKQYNTLHLHGRWCALAGGLRTVSGRALRTFLPFAGTSAAVKRLESFPDPASFGRLQSLYTDEIAAFILPLRRDAVRTYPVPRITALDGTDGLGRSHIHIHHLRFTCDPCQRDQPRTPGPVVCVFDPALPEEHMVLIQQLCYSCGHDLRFTHCFD